MKFGRWRHNEPSTRVRQLEAVAEEAEPWRVPWPVASALAAVVTAVAGWILVTGFCVLGWISVPQLKASAVLTFSTQGWLLAHGVSLPLAGAQLSIMPLGLTAIIVIIGLGACQQASVHSRLSEAAGPGKQLLQFSGVFALSYVVILAIGRQVSASGSTASSLLGAIIFAVALPVVGFARALSWRPPKWQRIFQAVAMSLTAGVLVMIVAGAAAVAAALIHGRAQVMMIHESLLPGNLGAVMLLAGQLAWLPNLVLWGGSWAAGAGIQLGVDTVVSPAQTTLGMLPSIPVLGAVPPVGAMPHSCLLWLTSGVLAGVLAAVVLVRQLQTDARAQGKQLGIDVTAMAGALAGVACGLVFTLLQVPAGGDLGAVRLTSLGARMTVLLVMAPATMGLAGMATGAVLGWRDGSGTWRSVDAESTIDTAPVTDREEELPTTVVRP